MDKDCKKSYDNLWNFLEGETVYSEEQLEEDLRTVLNDYGCLDIVNERKKKQINELENKILKYDEIIAKLEEQNTLKDRQLKIKQEYLKIIYALGVDYDGLEKADSLKGLIDNLVEYAKLAIKNDDKTVFAGRFFS